MTKASHHPETGIPARSPRPGWFWIVLVLGAVLLGLYPFTVRALIRYGGLERVPGWTVGRTPEGLEVQHVDPGGPAAGKLVVGDRILGTNGSPPLPRGLGWIHFIDLRPGDSYTIRVARGAEEHEYTLTARFERSLRKLWLVQVPLLVLSFSFFATGLVVGLVRPGDRVARLYSLLALITGCSLVPFGVFIGESLYGRDRVVLSLARVFEPFVLPVIYHFFSEFPPGIPRRRVWSYLKVLLYAWGVAMFPAASSLSLVISGDAAGATRFVLAHASAYRLEGQLNGFFTPLALLAIVAVMIRSHVAVVDPTQRRRLRWVLFGSIASALPYTSLFLADSVMGALIGKRIEYFDILRAQSVAELFLAFLPVTFAYAVVKHRVLGVEVVIRRGLRYLLARRVLQAAVFLPALLLLVRVVANPDRTVAQILFDSPLYAALAVVAAPGLYARDRLGRWLDRRFFREAYDRERVLLDLAGEVRGRDSLADLARLVSERIESALHPRGVHLLFLDPGGEFRLAHSSGRASAGLRLRADSALARAMESRSSSLELPLRGVALTPEETSWLEPLGVRLAVPIGGGDRRLAGLLLLGEKKSEEPYSREDRTLLETVAGQIAIVYENASLRERAAEDARVKRDVLARVDARGVNLLKECPACGACYDRSEEICAQDAVALTLTLPVDRTIEGRYRLDHLLGRGGMGAVYEAGDLRLGRTVAVKVMTGAGLASPKAQRRFHREARASARLRHPNIVTVYDYGDVGPELAYIVMERLAGRTLRWEIQQTGGIPPETAAPWFDQIFEGVKSAHAEGVIHRDLKPANVLVSADERGAPLLKVLDFGIAKLSSDDGESRSLTEEGAVLGTLVYMSPEQLAGQPVDERTDVYSLGLMLLESLTGANPFQAYDSARVVAAILNDRVGLDGEAAEVRALDALLQRCLAKDRKDRFTTVGEMQRELVPAIRRCPPFHEAMGPDFDADTATDNRVATPRAAPQGGALQK